MVSLAILGFYLSLELFVSRKPGQQTYLLFLEQSLL